MFLDSSVYVQLEAQNKRTLLQFVVKLVGSEDDTECLVRESILLNQAEVLVALCWREMSRFTRIPSRSEKRKHQAEEEDEEQRLNLLESANWRLSVETAREMTSRRSTASPQRILKSVMTVLEAGNMCLLKCSTEWPFLSYYVVDPATVSGLVDFLQAYIEAGLNPAHFPDFFSVAENIIVLVSACKNCNDFLPHLNVLAGIMSLPFLSADWRQTDLKLTGKQVSALASAKEKREDGWQDFLYHSTYLLSLLPREVCPKWRQSVFKQVAARSPESLVR